MQQREQNHEGSVKNANESHMPTKALTKSALLLEIATETDTDRKTAAFFLEVITDIAL